MSDDAVFLDVYEKLAVIQLEIDALRVEVVRLTKTPPHVTETDLANIITYVDTVETRLRLRIIEAMDAVKGDDRC